MAEPSVTPSATERLDSLTLALVVSEEGVCTDKAVADLLRYAQSKDIVTHAVDFEASLADGYDESLKLDRGTGQFVPYYTIPMRRIE